MIVLSEIAWADTQIDKRIMVRERHFDEDGLEYDFDYMAPPNFDIDAKMQAHVDQLNEELSQPEQDEKQMAQELIDNLKEQLVLAQQNLDEISVVDEIAVK